MGSNFYPGPVDTNFWSLTNDILQTGAGAAVTIEIVMQYLREHPDATSVGLLPLVYAVIVECSRISSFPHRSVVHRGTGIWRRYPRAHRLHRHCNHIAEYPTLADLRLNLPIATLPLLLSPIIQG